MWSIFNILIHFNSWMDFLFYFLNVYHYFLSFIQRMRRAKRDSSKGILICLYSIDSIERETIEPIKQDFVHILE